MSGVVLRSKRWPVRLWVHLPKLNRRRTCFLPPPGWGTCNPIFSIYFLILILNTRHGSFFLQQSLFCFTINLFHKFLVILGLLMGHIFSRNLDGLVIGTFIQRRHEILAYFPPSRYRCNYVILKNSSIIITMTLVTWTFLLYFLIRWMVSFILFASKIYYRSTKIPKLF